MDPYRIRCLSASTNTKQRTSFSIAVIDRQLGNLKRSCMGEANKGDPLSVPEGWGEDLGRLHGLDWKQNLGGLTRELRCLEMYGCGVGLIAERFKQLLLDLRIGE